MRDREEQREHEAAGENRIEKVQNRTETTISCKFFVS